MFSGITFEYPYVLILLLLFIISAFYFKAKSATYYMPHLNIFKHSASKTNLLIPLLKYITIIFAILSLASPVKTSHIENIQKDGINIILSLDTSASMRAHGFNSEDRGQNRWQAVSDIVQDFIEKRVNDNIGLVVFGSAVMTASPLSYDNQAQKEIVDYLDIGIVGDKTAMVDSLVSSINILKTQKAKSNIIILLTDGEDTASKTPFNIAIKLAKKHNIKIYTIGIAQSNHILLNKISTSTNGQSFKAYSKKDLTKVYETINQLERVKIDGTKIILKEYYFFYTLFISLIALCFYIFLINKE